jgi:hypothetical protein
MTFLYDISDTTDTSSKMRLELGDTVEDEGILPDSRNFSDEELDYFYTDESDDFWNAVARAFDAASAVWSRYPESFHMGPEHQKIPAARYYMQRAQDARTRRQAPGMYDVEKVDYAMDTTDD